MKLRSCIAAVEGFLLVAALVHAQTREPLLRHVNRTAAGVVTSVADGDTVHVRLDSGEALTVRLDGIDAPENGEPYSAQARNQARVLLFDQRVELRGTDVDQYDRLVARLTVRGVDSSIELVKAGLACHFTRYSSDPALAAAERDARASGRGFWAAGAPKPACATNAARTSTSPGDATGTTPRPALSPTTPRPAASPGAVIYHGNRNSRVYHAPHCRNYTCKNCTVPFTSESDAQRAGFRPAGDCLANR